MRWINLILRLGVTVFFGGWSAVAFSRTPAFAQSNIVPDNTLGAESSIVIPLDSGLAVDAVGGGAIRGSNLFHSFREFNVSEERGAYFLSTNTNIQNILARITGNNRSEILGILGIRTIVGGKFLPSNANLFLINPNGIIFGKNARLDIGGSFVATTANAVQFGEKGNFSATNPEVPQLLTINPSAFFLNQINKSASIQNNAIETGLEVVEGKSLLLVGGNVNVDGGSLFAPSGRIELGGLAEAGKIEIQPNGNAVGLKFPSQAEFADVSLNNGAFVMSGGGGDIAINAKNVDILGRSFIIGGIGTGLGTIDSKAGDITLNATEQINIKDRSNVTNSLFSNAVGKGGNIRVSTGSLFVTNGSQFIANTYGKGDAGNVIIDTSSQVLLNGNRTAIFSSAESPQAVGNGGDIQITTGSLLATNGVQFVTSTLGQGKAGNIIINARDKVSLDNSSAFSRLRLGAIGQGGDIKISTGSLSMSNNAQLNTSTLGKGDAGNVIINAREAISLDGDNTSVFSNVEKKAIGRGGSIRISTGSLSATNGVQLLAETYGQGDAGDVILNVRDIILFDDTDVFSSVREEAIGKGGNIQINTGSLFVKNGARLTASTVGRGDAGNVIINARDSTSFDGTGQDANSPSAASTALETGGVGNSGDIFITTNSLSVTNGAQLTAATVGQGDAGNVIINARGNVSFDGTNSDGSLVSGALSTVDREVSVGKGGDIRITAGSLSVTNGAQLIASTRGQGDAGNVIINTRETVSVNGLSKDGFYASSLRSTVKGENAIGKGGDVRITTGSLSVTNGGILVTSTFGQGDAGNIQVNASNFINIFGSSSISGLSSGLFTFNFPSSTGKGGDITVDTPLFRISSGGVLDARTQNEAKGGNITVNGSIFEALNGGQLITTTSGSGHAGNITVNATEKVTVNGSDANFNERVAKFRNDDIRNVSAASGLFVRSQGSGDAGNIKISNTQQLTIQDGGRIEASTFDEGKGGNIDVTSDVINLLGTSVNGEFTSGLFSESSGFGTSASGGDITLKTRLLNIREGAKVSTETSNQGQGGNITIAARDAINLSGTSDVVNGTLYRSALSTLAEGSGAAGNIKVFETGQLTVQNGAILSAATFGEGKGGNIQVNADSIDLLGGSSEGRARSGIFSGTSGDEAKANAGDVTLTTKLLNIRDGALVSTQTFNQGQGGNLTVTAREAINLSGANTGLFSSTEGLGNAGNLRIIDTGKLVVQNGAQISASTRGEGKGGNIEVNADTVSLLGISADAQSSSSLVSDTIGVGLNANAGNITVNTRVLSVQDGASISTSTGGKSQAGDITITASEAINLSGRATLADGKNVTSGLFTLSDGSGAAGDIKVVNTGKLVIQNEARISASAYDEGKGGSISVNTEALDINSDGGILSTSAGTGGAGNINVNTKRDVNINDGYILTNSIISPGGSIDVTAGNLRMSGISGISTFSVLSPGGNVNITAKDIRLFNNSSISTFSGLSSGGNVNITANSILAFDDSDILAFAPEGQGGNITLKTPAFFGENYRPASGTDLASLISLSSNNRVDINATGIVSGVISTPDTTFIQNSLTELPANTINTNALIANSCIARRNQRQEGTFLITGIGALPPQPGDNSASMYTTGAVRNVSNSSQSWKKGDPIVEPQGVYQLTDGRLVMSRECK
jgi:filamentous hemagglutinin family protein